MCYFYNVFNYPKETIDSIVHELKNPILGDIDFIVGTGLSGTLLLIPVSMKSKIPCAVVRKQDEDAHSKSTENLRQLVKRGSSRSLKRYVIIDDFIEEGNTVKKIINILNDENIYNAYYCDSFVLECAGIILYQSNTNFTNFSKEIGVPILSIGEKISDLVSFRKLKQRAN